MTESKSLFKISDVLPALGGRLLFGNPNTAFSDYCIDSRYVESNTLFVPLMGQSRDGHQFIIDAVSKGAVGALVRSGHHQIHEIINWLSERSSRGGYTELEDVCIIEVRHTLVALQKLAEWFRSRFEVQVIGVTGSVGKTGTKEMLIQLLSAKWPTVGTEKNFNNEIGVPLALSRLNSKVKVAVIEMAMRARGEISLLSRIARPNIAIITNTVGSHVGRLGSFEEVYKAKSEIVDGMREGGTVVLNRRDPNIFDMVEEIRLRLHGVERFQFRYFDSSEVYHFSGLPPFNAPGMHNGSHPELPEADVWVENVHLHGLDGSTFKLCSKDEQVDVTLPLLGRGVIENLCGVACAVRELGVPLSEVAAASETLMPAPQRLSLFQLRNDLFLIDDCYNSSPASVQDSLELMLSIDPRYRKILILGDMLELGKFETLLHRQVAQTTLNQPFHAIYAVGPRMNAFNEVESSDNVELYYIEGQSDYERADNDMRNDVRFGDSFSTPRETPRHTTEAVILDDRAAGKLSALLLNQMNQDGIPTVILVKGSRALHLERIVNDLLSGTSY